MLATFASALVLKSCAFVLAVYLNFFCFCSLFHSAASYREKVTKVLLQHIHGWRLLVALDDGGES